MGRKVDDMVHILSKSLAHCISSSCIHTHSNVIGFLFPAYYSFKAIESSNKEDDKQWYVSLRKEGKGMGERIETQRREARKEYGDQ